MKEKIKKILGVMKNRAFILRLFFLFVLLSGIGAGVYFYKEKLTEMKQKVSLAEQQASRAEIAKKEAESSAKSQTAIAEKELSQRIEAETKSKEAEQKTREEEAKGAQQALEKRIAEQKLSENEAEELRLSADNDKDGLTLREEQRLGSSDLNLDSDGDGIYDGQDTHPAGGGRNVAQTFAWSYGGYNWTWTEYIQEDWFTYYRDKRPRPNPLSVEYVTYMDPFIQKISKMISERASEKNIDKGALAEAFVQSLSYVDDVYTGYDEYPKYPVETFFEKNGDCEDTSYLTASILTAMNIGNVLIALPGHMAVGAWMDCSSSGASYEIDGRCYYYIETTGEGWTPGKIPDEYKNTSAKLIKIPSGEIVNNVSPRYIKPCYSASDFTGYYYDGSNYYSDSQCNNLAYCLPYEGLYYNYSGKTFYWDGGCTQIVVKGCSKATSYPGYFNNGIDYYSDSRCFQKARLCRPSPNYSDTYYDGYNEYWNNSCTQKVVFWCPKSTYHPGYFFNSIDSQIYIDSECTQKAEL